jgi:hypothetical protein
MSKFRVDVNAGNGQPEDVSEPGAEDTVHSATISLPRLPRSGSSPSV